jgi:hypothetical protein
MNVGFAPTRLHQRKFFYLKITPYELSIHDPTDVAFSDKFELYLSNAITRNLTDNERHVTVKDGAHHVAATDADTIEPKVPVLVLK